MVHVLEFVYEDVVVECTDLFPELLVLNCRMPEEKKIVEVEKSESPLSRHECAKDRRHLLHLVSTPRRRFAHHGVEGRTCVHRTRIQRNEGRLFWETTVLAQDPKLTSNEVHEICGVAVVENPEAFG